MSPHRSVRLPISTRHAFALAFDLAVRRDIVHSLLVPLLLRAPWIIALAVLPAPAESDRPGTVTLLTATALIGDFLMLVLVGAMLRFRARSVFNTRVEVHPAPIGDCYAQGLGRVPWLVVTEIVRNLAILFATCFFVFPGIVLGFRLSFATEAVVLHDPNTSAAFRRSYHLTPGRFERWLEMIAVSVALILGLLFAVGTASLVFRDVSVAVWVATARLLVTAATPVIQYAWTFFYLRLVEVELPYPGGVPEPGPLYASAAPEPDVSVPPPAAPALPAAALPEAASGSPLPNA